MSDHPLEQLDPQVLSRDNSSSTVRIRKHDKLHGFLGIPKFKSKDIKQMSSNQLARPSSIDSQISNNPLGDNRFVVSSPVIQKAKLQPLLQSSPPNKAQVDMDVFPDNIPKPARRTELPHLQERIESADQLVYCTSLLLQGLLHSSTVPKDDVVSDASLCSQEVILDDAEIGWLEKIKKDPMEQNHLRSLLTRMVEAFVANNTKDSAEIAEIVTLGPVLQKKLYRKLLSFLIKSLDDAHILDVNLLQGLVELVQSASSDYLVSDDLVSILSILRVSLQGTHQRSIEHSHHLTLAVSKVLDVMADHKVQDLDRVLQHEPLSEVLSGIKGSSDPYVMYQACYAFQALQYVPDDESVLQAKFRHSIGVANGLVKVSGMLKLDLVLVLEGLGELQESLGGTVEVASAVYEGESSLMESGQGVFDSLKGGLITGQKRPWYLAIKAACAFAQAGQLKDLRQLIFEAPCRHDPLFQWGICQLLGEIADDPVWEDAIRQQAITLLGHLFKVDGDWGHDESIMTWMLTIISHLSSTFDQAVNTIALALLQDVDQDKSALIQSIYPLTIHISIPTSSPILAKVYNTHHIEHNLHKWRLQRLEEIHLRRLEEVHLNIYIPLMAKANLQACDDDFFPLMNKVQEFLASDRQVMLILGDSGSGKSTFNKHLEWELMRTYTQGGPIPLFINLPAIEEPQQYMIEKQLKIYNFSDNQIEELKQNRQLVLICDGYDESQQLVNLYKTNSLNQPGQWNAKMVISCRSQYLSADYRSQFIPQCGSHDARPTPELLQEAAITPFSKEQIAQYIEQYVPLKSRVWTVQDYVDKLEVVPNLMDLAKNPFVLTLALEVLPFVVEGKQELSAFRITRVQLYDTFVLYWLDFSKKRLEDMALSVKDRDILDQLKDADFDSMATEYSTNLASAIFEQQGGNPVVQYIHSKDNKSWKAEFFGPDPKIRLLRESSPLSRIGSLFRFLHRSMQEYFYSRTVFNPSPYVENDKSSQRLGPDPPVIQSLDRHGSLFTRNLLTEPSVIQFLSERVRQHSNFEKQLLVVIELSKTDPTAATAATNAITILVRAGIRFNGMDFRGIRIPGADLSDSQLDSAQLQNADLTDVTFARSWMRQMDLSGAQMDGARFGELPFLKQEKSIFACAYSPDGTMLAVGDNNGLLSVYDTKTWNKAYQHWVDGAWIICIAFSPNSQQLLYGTVEHDVRLWTFASKDAELFIEGHAGWANSVAFSPCGKQLASASVDKTVRLCSAVTGKCMFLLKGHTGDVMGVVYCADGKRLVSGSSEDGTIRVWDSETGEQVACWNTTRSEYSTLAFSADGQWVAVASLVGKIQIMNSFTGELGAVLHDKSRTRHMAFSPNGQWIVTSSDDSNLRLWDLSSSLIISSFSGHARRIYTCSFSPSGFQIASGDDEGIVRLWEVNTNRVILDLDRPIGHVFAVQYSPDGQSILSYSDGQGVQQWDSRSGVHVPLPLKIAGDVSSFTLSPDGNQIATGHKYGIIRLWSRQENTAGCRLCGFSEIVTQLAYSPCGRWIVSVSEDKAILWDLHTDKYHPDFISLTDRSGLSILCVTFTPTSQIVLWSDDDTLRLHDPRAQDPYTALKEISMYFTIHSLNCSPSGKEIAIGAGNGTVYLWDFHSDKPGMELKGHDKRVRSVAYSPCGKWILSGGNDKTVRIWRFRTGEVGCWYCVAVVGGCSKDITCVAWSPVVALEFVTGCLDGSVRVWRIESHGDADGGDVSVRMLWGNDVGLFCALDLMHKSAIGLTLINQKLLVQRGAIDD